MNSSTVLETPTIRVRQTLSAAWRLFALEWKTLLKMLIVPSAFLALVSAMMPDNPEHALKASSFSVVANSLFFGFSVLFQPWVMVSGLRFLVLGEKSPEWWPAYHPYLWRFLWKTICMALILVLPLLLLSVIFFALLPAPVAGSLTLAGLLAVSLMSGRLMPAIPASAFDGDNTLKTAWAMTRGQSLRILTIKFLSQLALGIPLIAAVVMMLVFSPISMAIGKFLMLFIMSAGQFAITLSVDAILYGHFYRGMVVTEIGKDESDGF